MKIREIGWTIPAIKDANAAAGLHFFDPDSCRFFDSRILPNVYEGPGGVYFITSEQFHPDPPYTTETRNSDPRRYSVRHFNTETGHITTVGPFNKYAHDEAVCLAHSLSAGALLPQDVPRYGFNYEQWSQAQREAAE